MRSKWATWRMSGGYSLPCFCDFFLFLTPSPDGVGGGGGL